MADKKEESKVDSIFKIDYPTGTDKKGNPKKTYKKGETYPLDAETATYLKSKNIIQ